MVIEFNYYEKLGLVFYSEIREPKRFPGSQEFTEASLCASVPNNKSK